MTRVLTVLTGTMCALLSPLSCFRFVSEQTRRYGECQVRTHDGDAMPVDSERLAASPGVDPGAAQTHSAGTDAAQRVVAMRELLSSRHGVVESPTLPADDGVVALCGHSWDSFVLGGEHLAPASNDLARVISAVHKA